MRITYNVPAEPNTRYGKNAFNYHVGKFQKVKIGKREVDAQIVEVVVADDGRSVLWTVDIPEAPEILANPN